MKHAVLGGLCAVVLSGAVHGEIYETRDDKGDPVFTDTPSSGAQEVELHEANIADPLQPLPADESGTSSESSAEGSDDSHSPIVVIPDSHNEQVQDAFEEGQRREVLDAEPRREVREAEPRHEVGDFGESKAR